MDPSIDADRRQPIYGGRRRERNVLETSGLILIRIRLVRRRFVTMKKIINIDLHDLYEMRVPILYTIIIVVVVYILSPHFSPPPPHPPIVTPSPRRHHTLPLSVLRYMVWDDRYRGEKKRIIQICPFLFVFINRSRQHHHNNVLFVVVCQLVIIYATCITLSAIRIMYNIHTRVMYTE